MIAYFDTSALVKLYRKERGNERARMARYEASLMVTSVISYAELYSALYRAVRLQEIREQEFEECSALFESDWRLLDHILLTQEILDTVKQVLREFVLRAADSIHLSSALYLARHQGEPVCFVCFDRSLVKAALQSGAFQDVITYSG
ncbi:type II toxin-antitoxin system VapC family toxin [Acidobacteria bacterium AH-259-A15]|nr:type II toxin-antitoxin system VapC family toxin [Acidobacteria bacterium AH-259-A15]